ncbi:hypothetical protein AV540_20350 [Brevibacillus parabrevis]|uniref:hypothetical protein n=1 Tax=Brevibacillus parabrevis TaxID=54914 RepID=UPI0007ABB5B0|nr:hypothetical protein [Brevibacillus parabrevis]KZE47151.1 hypothetical protein AV540_20350 [Brevibacillus parabrevis]
MNKTVESKQTNKQVKELYKDVSHCGDDFGFDRAAPTRIDRKKGSAEAGRSLFGMSTIRLRSLPVP